MQSLHYGQPMVTAHRIGSIRIDVRGREHNPPHVHIDGPNGPVRVFLNDMTVLGSRKTIRASGEALAWVEANRQALLQLWEELNP